MRQLKYSLSPKSIDELIKGLKKEELRVVRKNRELVVALCKLGQLKSKANIAGLRAIDTGALESSIDYGFIQISTRTRGSVYAGVPYAKYVEYGWGLGGLYDSHPYLNPTYVYNYNGRNLTGYFSRPYMYMSMQSLKLELPIIAREVFATK